jgi:hypothetical protein
LAPLWYQTRGLLFADSGVCSTVKLTRHPTGYWQAYHYSVEHAFRHDMTSSYVRGGVITDEK